ncbi:MAG: hypothetical protein ACJAYU_001504 [Bradymonadia bacterium]|jgi:uncharacterized protein (DUF58 family)
MHRNPHRGSSVEFAEYKEYAPGDDIRHIDWRAYGRIDRYYVKQFEDETNVRAYMLLDSSGSMSFSFEAAPTKLLYASTLLASLAHVLLKQGDAPGLLTFDDRPRNWLPPSSSRKQLSDICTVLDTAPGTGRTSIERALSRVAERVFARSLVVLTSDFLETGEDVLTLAQVLRRRGMEVVLFHVLDRAEWTLPFEGLTFFEGLEEDGELLVDPDDVRDAYQELFREHASQIEATAHRGDLEYFRTYTDEPVERVLLDFIRSRRRRSR